MICIEPTINALNNEILSTALCKVNHTHVIGTKSQRYINTIMMS